MRLQPRDWLLPGAGIFDPMRVLFRGGHRTRSSFRDKDWQAPATHWLPVVWGHELKMGPFGTSFCVICTGLQNFTDECVNVDLPQQEVRKMIFL